MAAPHLHSFSGPWLRRSVLWLAALAIFAFAVGFAWLPNSASDFSAQGLWASICRAAGVPGSWAGAASVRKAAVPTEVVLDRQMAAPGAADSVGRGATLALNCTMCHGAQGRSVSDAPNLAGQYPEVIIKQLRDFQSGKRRNSIMEALAHGLSEQQVADLAAYYAYLPKARNQPTTYGEDLPLLVRDGAPMRNIAPCISCHGSVDQKLGAPWLEGMPRAYLAEQLVRFRSGERGNDSHAQMRNMARAMTNEEIGEVAAFYARHGSDGREH
jgi:cytochrome c553